MKFKKIIAALLLSALLTSLCACGKTEEIKVAVVYLTEFRHICVNITPEPVR
jgi:uncharacterized lipoprotein YehR (DUF1307 family)